MLSLGDRVRLAAHPKAPPMTVELLYLQGDPEALWVGGRWHKTAPLYHAPASDLMREGTP
jgi:hypothetical protein